MSLFPVFNPGNVHGAKWRMAADEGVTTYDALYIGQALRYGSLATSDEKQGKIAEKLGVEVTHL